MMGLDAKNASLQFCRCYPGERDGTPNPVGILEHPLIQSHADATGKPLLRTVRVSFGAAIAPVIL